MKETTIYNEKLNHQEQDEGSQWNVSSYISNSKFICQEEFTWLDSFEKHNDSYFETHENNQVVNL